MATSTQIIWLQVPNLLSHKAQTKSSWLMTYPRVATEIFDSLQISSITWFLTHLWPMLPFYTPWKHQKTQGVYNRNIEEKWVQLRTEIYLRIEKFQKNYRKLVKDLEIIYHNTQILSYTLINANLSHSAVIYLVLINEAFTFSQH